MAHTVFTGACASVPFTLMSLFPRGYSASMFAFKQDPVPPSRCSHSPCCPRSEVPESAPRTEPPLSGPQTATHCLAGSGQVLGKWRNGVPPSCRMVWSGLEQKSQSVSQSMNVPLTSIHRELRHLLGRVLA